MGRSRNAPRRVKLEIGGKIKITDIDLETRHAIKDSLKIKNPSYQQAIRANPKARYALSEYINYYEEKGLRDIGPLFVPRGTLGRLVAYATGRRIEIEQTSAVVTRPEPALGALPSINPRDYQRGVVESCVQFTQGVLELDTGFGKTVIGLELARQNWQRTLIIVPKLDLLSQWQREAKTHFDYEVGIFQGKTFSPKEISVGTVQSVQKFVRMYPWFAESFGCIIVDECHLFTSKQRMDLIGQFPAMYRYGLTATSRRSDGQGEAINFLFGPKLLSRKMERAHPTVEIHQFKGKIFVQEYAEMINEQVRNDERNWMIAKLVEFERNQGRKVLVLTKRVEHYEEIRRRLSSAATCFSLDSGAKREERAEFLEGARNGTINFDCLLGTLFSSCSRHRHSKSGHSRLSRRSQKRCTRGTERWSYPSPVQRQARSKDYRHRRHK